MTSENTIISTTSKKSRKKKKKNKKRKSKKLKKGKLKQDHNIVKDPNHTPNIKEQASPSILIKRKLKKNISLSQEFETEDLIELDIKLNI